ncbi:MAG: hypothetical protein L6Q83_01160, partial [Gammaproteobacteria bacterium]|nr:hypothetical protein [Gammaproteobacteria bacterium]
VAARVAGARYLQQQRAGALNAHLTPAGIRRWCLPETGARALLEQAAARLRLSRRACDSVLRVARTIADLAGDAVPRRDQVAEALALRGRARLIAPDLLVAECANILWKKVRRRELTRDEALLAGRLLQGADIELVPMRPLLAAALRLALELDHPAYDCAYLALA